MIKFLQKKFHRLMVSKNVMKIFYFFHFLTGGFKSKKIDISFSDKISRIEIVKQIISLKQYKSYLEIGTFRDELFKEVKCDKKIGVDPISGGNIRKTSDNFFLENDKKFDLIFIDGLHHYNQVKKDIFNSLNNLNPGGVILMHDCMPKDYYHQAVPRSQYNWNGDTWKAFIEYRVKEEVDSYCCYADQGIGVILKRKNKNKLNLNVKNFNKLNFNDYANNYKNYLNLISYNQLIDIIKNYE
tara:strand:- start:87 stop:809 length:723 start_codon:yes stop_codon:yes gene_type:complete